MQAFAKLTNFAIESENIDLLISLMTGTKDIPFSVEKRVLKFVERYAKKNNIPLSCQDFVCFVENYRKWLLEKVYKSGDFVQFVAEASPKEIKDILEGIQRLMGDHPLEMEVYGAVFYWLVLHNESLPAENKVDFKSFLINLQLIQHPTFDQEWEERLNLFVEGLLEEATRNRDYGPVYLMLKEGYFVTDILNQLSTTRPRDFIDWYLDHHANDYGYLFDQLGFYLADEDLLYLALVITSRLNLPITEKARLALSVVETMYDNEPEELDVSSLVGLEIDPVFWNNFIYGFVRKKIGNRFLPDLLSLRPYDEDFDPYVNEKARVLATIKKAM